MRVVIIGGSLAGLATALMLARGGHDVTVLERDPQPAPPDLDAAAGWARPTVPQTLHSHSVNALGRLVLARRLPDVLSELLDRGAGEYRLVPSFPPMAAGADRIDPARTADLVTLGVRRTTLEWVLRRRALAEPRIDWRPGVVVEDLRWRRNRRVPTVDGVRTRQHGNLPADAVIDASGRRSRLPDWLLARGVRINELTHDCEMVAHSRFYALRDGLPPPPPLRGNASVVVLDGFGCYAFLSDDRTIAVSIGRLPGDRILGQVQDPARFDAVVHTVGAVAALVDPARTVPISGVTTMAGLRNTFRYPLRDGRAPVHGLHVVGDALATTNPAFGRGVSLAFRHAEIVADALAAEPHRADARADRIARELTDVTLPVWRDSVAHDRERIHRWRTTLGVPGQAPPPRAVSMMAGVLGGMVDAEVFVRVMRAIQLLDPPGAVFDDPALAERIRGLPLPVLPVPGSRRDAVTALTDAPDRVRVAVYA